MGGVDCFLSSLGGRGNGLEGGVGSGTTKPVKIHRFNQLQPPPFKISNMTKSTQKKSFILFLRI